MPNSRFTSVVCLLVVIATLHEDGRNRDTSLVYAYTSDFMPQRRPSSLSRHDERPLVPPFPNGSNGGTVVTLPRRELFHNRGEEGVNDDLSFLNLNLGNPFSSLEHVVLPPRDVKVWLPREYHSPKHRRQCFPILYCHDGQNAMEDASSWTGSSWRLIGALTRLYERKMLLTDVPPIVVQIPCGEGDILPGISRRHSEYGDFTHPVSQAHGNFVATRLHPYIMNRFRVKDGPESTSTIGSSLGGQASIQLILRYPEIFGGAACMSPCFQPGTIAAVMANLVASDEVATNIHRSDKEIPSKQSESMLQSLGKGESEMNPYSLHSKKIYIDNGGDAADTRVPVFEALDHFTLNERWWNPGYWWLDTSLQPMIDAMRWTLDQGRVEYIYEKFPGGRHNERAWAKRIHRPLLALYGDKSKY